MRDQSQQAEEHTDQRIAIRQPRGGKTMRVVHCVQQGRQSRDPGASERASVEQRGHYHHSTQPNQRVQVHERWHFGPELVVEPVGKAGQRSEKSETQLFMGPPRQHAHDNEPPIGRHVPLDKDKQLGR